MNFLNYFVNITQNVNAKFQNGSEHRKKLSIFLFYSFICRLIERILTEIYCKKK